MKTKAMTRKKLFAMFIALAQCFACLAGDVKPAPAFPGKSHAMLRLEANERFILLPVEEKTGICNINIIYDNKSRQSLNVRLAADKVDYYVPLDISGYKGREILLDINALGDVLKNGSFKDYVCWQHIRQSADFDTANREPHRPLYHHTPAYGWMNDPNGMFYNNGEYHLYYQWNPYGSQWENMHWGHSVSRDLIHWENCPAVLAPDDLGTIFSGSSVVDKDNTAGFGAGAIVAFYTSAGKKQTQSIAYSTDNGNTFTKYHGNPVIIGDVPDFRDPNVFWNEELGKWNLILAAGQEMRIYSSADLKNWTYESSFGKGFGNHGGVWECPDLMKVSSPDGKTEKWVLVCNINPGGPAGGSATQYFTGSFDGRTFTCDSKPETTKWLDYGKDHYAAVSFDNAPDGRQVLVAWMSNWQYADRVPTQQYRSANSIARDLFLFNDGGETYVGSAPSQEYLKLRGKKTLHKSFSAGRKAFTAQLPDDDGTCEIKISLDPAENSKLQFTLNNDKGEKVTVEYDSSTDTLSMNRHESGTTGFSNEFACRTAAPVLGGTLKELRMFVDKSSIEIFANGGRTVMTNIVFPSEPYKSFTIESSKKTKVKSLDIYDINI